MNAFYSYFVSWVSVLPNSYWKIGFLSTAAWTQDEIRNGKEKLNSATFLVGIPVGSLEEFQKNSALICKIPIGKVRINKKTYHNQICFSTFPIRILQKKAEFF